ncbi:MAG: hypothetical protein CM15mV19_1320 [uncultured marine virus]|nr:MAG: hypothetical protein CM15mV19_1320 [uncultured marine virus]
MPSLSGADRWHKKIITLYTVYELLLALVYDKNVGKVAEFEERNIMAPKLNQAQKKEYL